MFTSSKYKPITFQENIDIGAVNKENENPLTMAISYNLEAIADILLERGCTFTDGSSQTSNVCMYVCMYACMHM